MSAILQPRRYYPRWGKQDPSTPAGPLTYRTPPEKQHQQQQHQQQDGSVPDNKDQPTPPTPPPASPVMATVASQSEAGAGADGGSGAGGAGEQEGDQETAKAATTCRKRFNGLLADRFQHPFDLVRA